MRKMDDVCDVQYTCDSYELGLVEALEALSVCSLGIMRATWIFGA